MGLLNEIKVFFVGDSSKLVSEAKQADKALEGVGKSSGTSQKALGSLLSSLPGVGGAFSSLKGKMGESSEVSEELGGKFGHMGTMVAAGAAVAAVGVAEFVTKSAEKFVELGAEVEKFAAVSGAVPEEASKFVAVAKEFGVGADTLAGSVGKLGATLGNNSTALEKYGVSAALAKDGSIDLQATTLKVIDAFNHSKSASDADALGKAAFGKGYQSLVPLITAGSDKIAEAFGKVDKAEIFDAKKIAEAKDFGVKMEELKKKFEDVELTVGEKLIPVMEEFMSGLTKLAGPVSSVVATAFDGLVNGIQDVAYVLTVGLLGDFRKFNDALPTVTANVDDATAAMLLHARYVREAADGYGPLAEATKLATEAQDAHTAAVEAYTGPSEDMAAAEGDQAEATKIATDAMARWKAQTDAALKSAQVGIDETKFKWDELRGAVSDDQAWVHLQQSFADAKQSGVASAKAVQDAQDADAKAAGTRGKAHVQAAADAAAAEATAQAAILTTKDKVDSLKLALIDMAQKYGDIPLEKTTKLTAELDAGQLEAVLAQMQTIVNNHKISAQIVAKSGAGYGGVNKGGDVPQFADGGVVPGRIGEPLLAVVHGGEVVVPAERVGKHSAFTPVEAGGASDTTLEQIVRQMMLAPEGQLVMSGRDGQGTNTPGQLAASRAVAVTNTYHITVTVPGMDVGGAIIDAITKHERVNGSSWRA